MTFTAGNPVDAELAIANGEAPGYSIVNKYGRNGDISTATVPEDVWGGGGVYTGFPNTTLETLAVSSASANDAADGTGARTIRLIGLDADYNTQSETVILNGTTPVNTVNTYRRCHTGTVVTAGSGGVNAGAITVTHTTTTANVFLNVSVGSNQSFCSCYTIPAGYTAYLRDYICTVLGNTQASVTGLIWTRPFGGVWRQRRPFTAKDTVPFHDTVYGGLIFTEKSDMILRITECSNNNVAVAGGYDLVLVQN